MHHCLEVAELVWLLAECMDEENDRLPTLRSMALTCRGFSKPVFRVLWRDLDSLVPLLRCFPEDLWGKADDEEGWIRVRAGLLILYAA